MSSPSFGIVHQYGQDPIVYHFDLYRLQSATELREIGMDDYLDSPHWIFIEWPEIAADILKEEGFFHLDIHTMENNQRMINLEK
jgi:tRNA threonylcarbamoyladenosine biosynthesis protein TsaE